MRFRAVVATLGATVMVLGLVPGLAEAAPAAAGSVIRPVRPCADLVRGFDIPGAATRVTSATVVPAGAEPAHCDVHGVVAPAIQFQLRLPTETYGGRYLQYGCGGFCGFINPSPFPDCGPKVGDFAVAATDDGHVGVGPFPPVDGTWAANNQAARDDFFFRAPHALSKAAKRIIAAFYGSAPRRSYFSGCSNGGREAMLLAQRYPTDFDGIIAGAPAINFGPLVGIYETWLVRSNTSASGEPIITAAKLPALHDAVLAACDGLDGLVDKQIDDPRGCRFDPATLRCPGADAPSCLTQAQVDAARRLYAGPTDEHGRRLYPGWQPFGSEPAWEGWIIPSPQFGNLAVAAELGDNYLRYLGYPIGTPHSSLADFRFTAPELHRLTPEGRKVNALSLDLDGFRRAGGKLIIWHGQADQGIPPASTVDYYARLVDRVGGLRETQAFARLFMVPGIFHCGGGANLATFDPTRELVAWVEQDAAPQRVIATGPTRSRPVFPYPLVARYDGSGSIDDAANFVPARPAGRLPEIIPWVGSYLHHIPGPVSP
jgi:hypothetical protein